VAALREISYDEYAEDLMKAPISMSAPKLEDPA
jgi:hypothetical protein